jgi:hypothetical protein
MTTGIAALLLVASFVDIFQDPRRRALWAMLSFPNFMFWLLAKNRQPKRFLGQRGSFFGPRFTVGAQI